MIYQLLQIILMLVPYFIFYDQDDIAVGAVAVDNDDQNNICGQFDLIADATVTNLLIYLHESKQ